MDCYLYLGAQNWVFWDLQWWFHQHLRSLPIISLHPLFHQTWILFVLVNITYVLSCSFLALVVMLVQVQNHVGWPISSHLKLYRPRIQIFSFSFLTRNLSSFIWLAGFFSFCFLMVSCPRNASFPHLKSTSCMYPTRWELTSRSTSDRILSCLLTLPKHLLWSSPRLLQAINPFLGRLKFSKSLSPSFHKSPIHQPIHQPRKVLAFDQ